MLNNYLLYVCVSCADRYPVLVQVQVRTRTPTGVQLDTMDLDKLFDITNWMCLYISVLFVTNRIFISGTAVNNKRFMTTLVYCVLCTAHVSAWAESSRRIVQCAGLCRAINRPILILCKALSGCLSHLCSVLCRSRHSYYKCDNNQHQRNVRCGSDQTQSSRYKLTLI